MVTAALVYFYNKSYLSILKPISAAADFDIAIKHFMYIFNGKL